MSSVFDAIDGFAAFDWIVAGLIVGSLLVIATEAFWVWREHRAYLRRQRAHGGHLHDLPGHTRLGMEKAKHIDR